MRLFDDVKRSGPRLSVQLSLNCKRKTHPVHYLIALTFAADRKQGDYLVRHYDGDYKNNHVDNLLWGDAQDNSNDTKRYNNPNEEIDLTWI